MKGQIKSSWQNSIKVRLMVVMLAISTIPLLIFGFYNISVLKGEIEESIHRQHELAAFVIANAVTDVITTLETSLGTVSLTNTDALYSNDEAKKEELIYNILRNFPQMEELTIVSKFGKETAKVSKRYAYTNKDLGMTDENLFNELKQGKIFIGNPKLDIDNQMVFDFGVPVTYMNEEFIGGFIAKISLRQVMEEILSIELPEGSSIMLVDHSGKLVGHSDYSQVLRQQDVTSSKAVENLLKINLNTETTAKEFKSIVYTSYTGEEVLGVYGLIPTVGWGIIVEQPVVNAYSTLRTMILKFSAGLFIIIFIISIISMFIVLKITKPVEELFKGLSYAKKGDLDYQISYRAKDELGSVIEIFNKMIKEIKLRRYNEKVALQAEKRASIGLLAAGVAHEINNPLNNVGFYTEDLLERIETEDVNKLKDQGVFREYLLIISEQVQRCSDIIQSLLNFSREVKHQLKQVAITDVISEVLKLVKYPITKQNIEVELLLEESVPYIYADESQLLQVMLNLVTNAIDAMPTGGKLIIKSSIRDKMVCLEVIDTGDGITEENFKHVFDPFYTTKPLGKGTGLGLSINQSIVERCGGEISLENNKEKGVTARVAIPIKDEEIKHG